jgi:hypothetical protein
MNLTYLSSKETRQLAPPPLLPWNGQVKQCACFLKKIPVPLPTARVRACLPPPARAPVRVCAVIQSLTAQIHTLGTWVSSRACGSARGTRAPGHWVRAGGSAGGSAGGAGGRQPRQQWQVRRRTRRPPAGPSTLTAATCSASRPSCATAAGAGTTR